MRVMFFGTPSFAIPSFEKLVEKHEVLCVFTQPDRPKGRGHKLAFSPVKEKALSLGLKIYQPEKISEFDLVSLLKDTKCDVAVVVAYGQKIPKEALKIPKYGFINVHASILPQYRGAAPIERAMLDGISKTGVTIMYMAEGMDTGDIGLVKEVEISDEMNGQDLLNTLASYGSTELINFLDDLKDNKAKRVAQNNLLATHAKKLDKADMSYVNGDSLAVFINKVRTFAPNIGVRCSIKGINVKIYEVKQESDENKMYNGSQVIVNEKGDLLMSFSEGLVRILELQPESKKRMEGSEFVRGYRIQSGDQISSLIS